MPEVSIDKKNVTVEQILESGAQVVFWSRPGHEELVASLEETGVICINVRVDDSEGLLKAVHIISDSFGTEHAQEQAKKYDELYAQYYSTAERIASTIPESEKKTVLVIGSVDTPSAGPLDSYQGFWRSTIWIRS